MSLKPVWQSYPSALQDRLSAPLQPDQCVTDQVQIWKHKRGDLEVELDFTDLKKVSSSLTGLCFREVWGGWTPPPDTHCKNPDSPREVWSGSHRLASLTPPMIPGPKSRAENKGQSNQQHPVMTWKTWFHSVNAAATLWRQTHHFRGDVSIWEVSVLTHNGKVAVHVYGQCVSSQHHNPAERRQMSMCHHGGTIYGPLLSNIT